MILIRLLILLACLALAPAAVSFGAGNHPSDGDIAIKADAMDHDQAADTFNASGHVELEWEGMVLHADRASYDRKARILIASGNIVMTKGGDSLKGNRFTMDLETGRIELEHGAVSIRQGNITFTGEKIVREDEINLVLSGTELTTCDLPGPFWKFGADKLRVNLLGYAIGRNIVFYVKDVPVLYIPWIAFPVVRERRTGLLFPRFGYSNTRGAEIDIPAYWVIAPNQDLQLNLDLLSKRGVGTGTEYRYARKRGSEGSIGGYLIYDLLDERWRGQIAQNHKEIFSADMNLRMAINKPSDRNFLREYGEKSGDYNRQSSDSYVNFLKTWQHYALTANLRHVEDLYAADNSRTLQTLPEIGLAAVRRQIASTPLYFDLDASAANLYQGVGPSGQRLHAFPRLSLVAGLPEYLHASAFAGAHLRAYKTDDIPAGSGISESELDLLPELGGRVSTSLSRVFTIKGDELKKLRHELVPELSYSYTPGQDQTRLPFYDFNDRLIQQNIVYYSLTNLLGGKFQHGETSEYRDLMRLKLWQGYSFVGTRRDLLTLVDANRPWTDLVLESDARLHPQVKMTLDARYNVYDWRISSVAPGAEFDDTRGNIAGISYRLSRNEVEYLEGRLSSRFYKPWTFGYSTRYSFDRPGGYLDGFLESVYSVEYRHKCWGINVALRDRPGSTSFMVNINLVGLTGS
ncbi:MAG: LPS-assembly protein LptD [Deltaproteobacteria bacterium]|nr:LPS-assembly protein LptD [Deltaproteobacteria bacterium]